ncbi:AAA domain-containing protein [Streptacidiphilus sp. P02-A3a]|uniref:AAA domain-containing protein n=1 Tax=Streptacidiphilus sp. P02-A3a TaxID=2704468 RepID=UPI0015FA2C20|nr:AAA domain-containing protein [Streptacidiphilus sp. P02-A3a]QMU71840.1 AAA family ATPase [Streptacidiphilus sp. P02-A3a]
MAEQQHSEPAAELLTAVRAEITACRRDASRDSEKIVLHAGRRVRGGERAEYLFACRSWRDSFNGKSLLVRLERSEQPWAVAEAARLPDGTVRVLTAVDLGPAPASALLREDDASTWVVLAERLEAAGQSGSPVDAAMAGLVLGLGSPTLGQAANPAQLIAGWNQLQLNPAQRTAVERALGSNVLFLWGPPGTGKTDVVSHIAEGCYRQGLNLLFLAPTHVAVDQALERMCDLLQGEPGFADGLVQRSGEIAVASLEQKYGGQVDPVRIAGRLGEQIDAALATARARMDEVRADLRMHDRVAELTEALTAAWKRNSDALTTLENATRALLQLDADAANLRVKIGEIGTPSGLMANRKTVRLQELQGQLAATVQVQSGIWYQQQGAQKEEETTTALINDLGPQLTALQSSVAGLQPRARLAEQADALQQELDELDRQRRGLADAVRARCRVKGATVAKAVQSRKLLDRVDVVILDEAGMVDLPSAWYVAGLAGKRLVLAGDFRQLPAITKGGQDPKATEPERAHSRQWAERDAFHAAGLVAAAGSARLEDRRLVGLNTQYRMDSSICGLVNTVAYPDAPLRTGRGDGSRLPPSALLDGPLVLVDTSSRRITGRDHKSNTVHEAVIHQLVRGLQYDAVLPGRNWTDLPPNERPADRLAVIAPYRDQVRALNSSLGHRFGEEYEGLVDTVHRFQGSQRPLVVIDTVAGAGTKPGFFYEGTGLSSQTCRLLNVALSRAQDHVVVVADVEHLRAHLAPHSEVVRMLDHLEQHAVRLPIDQLVPIRSASDLGRLSEEELARPAFFPADEVGRAVAWDLHQARKSIEVYCAFLDRDPVHYWSGPFRKLAARGVQVTVFTRKQDKPWKARLVEDLRTAGCRVEQRERMHEKVLIVDESVLWHGSLNLLSNSGPTDLMMRITDTSACRRVRRIIDRARPERPTRPQSTTATTDSDPVPTGSPRAVPAPPAGSAAEAPGPRAAADRPAPGVEINGRLYLNVPFAQKDEAKRELRAEWDRQNKLWWVTPDKRRAAHRWLPPTA